MLYKLVSYMFPWQKKKTLYSHPLDFSPLAIILSIVCEAPTRWFRVHRFKIHSCVNFREQNRILDCTGGPSKICFNGDFCHDTTSLLLLFPKYQNFYFSFNISNNLKSNFIYLIISVNINFVIFLCIMLVQITWKGSFYSIVK